VAAMVGLVGLVGFHSRGIVLLADLTSNLEFFPSDMDLVVALETFATAIFQDFFHAQEILGKRHCWN